MARLRETVAFGLLVLLGATSANAQQSLVIVSNVYPPYVDENGTDSFLPALFDAVGEEMGVTFEFQIMPWLRCEQAVESHDAWGAVPYRKTETRQQSFEFSVALYQQDSHFFAYDPTGRKPEIPFNELEDLRAYRIGGIHGYYYEPWYDKAGLDVEYVHSEEQNFRRLQAGRIDLFSTATNIGWYSIRTLFPPEEVTNFYTLEKPLLDGDGLHVMTSKTYPDNAVLLQRFNDALTEIKADGTYAALAEKYGLRLGY